MAVNYPKAAIELAFQLLPSTMDSKQARIALAAIGYQESKYLTRVQYGGGPAHSYWQFENGKLSGINGVLNHKSTAAIAAKVCEQRGVAPERMAVWRAMEVDDVLGAAFARLLIYTDPFPLPITQEGTWIMYVNRLWRPGKPHPENWPASYAFGVANA